MAGIEVPERFKQYVLCLQKCSGYVVTCCFMEPLLKMWGNCHLYFICSLKGTIFNIIESICGARMHPGWFRMEALRRICLKVGRAELESC
ncbi:MAG: hypothetical protein Ct9H90mP25_3030 [Gammaproteobacteria bacterium]|nr:MAG: hypothetical protein Ct9H90mP25_3030 [Gammaproteobacteria bacterium]